MPVHCLAASAASSRQLACVDAALATAASARPACAASLGHKIGQALEPLSGSRKAVRSAGAFEQVAIPMRRTPRR